MDYEKKYKEALEKLRSLHDDYDTVSTLIDIKEELEHIFPELKVDEDERIRKDIIEFFENCNIKHLDWIAWLEKQGNQKLPIEKLPEEMKSIGESLGFRTQKECDEYNKMVSDLIMSDDKVEQKPTCLLDNSASNVKFPFKAKVKSNGKIVTIQDGQLSMDCEKWVKYNSNIEDGYTVYEPEDLELVDKIEPKFKVGDWIIRSAEGFKHNTYLITEVKDYYVCEELKGRRVTFTFNDVHKNFKLWDISDAKDGNVVSNGKMIVIFKHFEEPSYRQHIVAYIGLDINGDIQITGDTWNLGIDKTKPATKEQRDTLFAKMKEAGYEWDAEKKELKKIEDKLQIKKGKFYKCIKSYHYLGGSEYWFDEGKVYFCEKDGYLRPNYNNLVNIYDCENWQSYFRPYTDTENSAWSGDDEAYMTYILVRLKQHICDENFIECNNWLKSIKERIGGKL